MDVTLHICREVVVDDFADTFKVHTAGHDFRRNHDPTFAPSHPAHSVLALFLGQSGVETVDVGYSIQNKFFGQRCGPSLG